MTLLIRSFRPTLRVLSRAPNIENEHVVAPARELRSKMVVGDRPERRIEPQPVAENHRQLARVGMRRPVIPNPKPPAILGVCIAVGARPKVGAGGIPAHADTARQEMQTSAEKSAGEENSPPTVHSDGNPFLPQPMWPTASLLIGARGFYRPSAALGTPARPFLARFRDRACTQQSIEFRVTSRRWATWVE